MKRGSQSTPYSPIFTAAPHDASLAQRHMKMIATKARIHKGILFFLNLVPWSLGGYFHSREKGRSGAWNRWNFGLEFLNLFPGKTGRCDNNMNIDPFFL